LADLQKRCFVLPKGKRRLSQGNVFLIGDLQLELGPAPMSPLRIVPEIKIGFTVCPLAEEFR